MSALLTNIRQPFNRNHAAQPARVDPRPCVLDGYKMLAACGVEFPDEVIRARVVSSIASHFGFLLTNRDLGRRGPATYHFPE